MNVPLPLPPRRTLLAVLVLGTLALYSRTTDFGFVNFDDPQCVTNVDMVKSGLSWRGVVWAFTEGVPDSHYKPLVNLSHMLDCSLFGLHAGGHHAMNVFWHTAAAVLLFLALERMTGSTGRSWLVAALFAWHPARVESVAWITERKDVLCGFFWMLSLWTHARHAERPGAARYVAVLASVLGAMLSKSMAVTLPFVLLLVDFWPLRRIRVPFLSNETGETAVPQVSLWRCLAEKLPLFALTAIVALVAMRVAHATDALGGQAVTTPAFRVANALVSYVRYIGMTLWPADLAVVYPMPTRVLSGEAIGATVLLAAITATAVVCTTRRPWLLAGWLWYLGTLVPVAGFIQIIRGSHADRYTYIPQVGLLVLLVWTVAEALREPRWLQTARLTSAAVLIACFAVAWQQIAHWRDTESLFRRAVAVTKDNWHAHVNLAGELIRQGRFDHAAAHVHEAIRLRPDLAEAQQNLGLWLAHHGRHAEARAQFQTVLRQRVGNPEVTRFMLAFERAAGRPNAGPDDHYNFANALLAFDRPADAIEPLRRVLALRTNDASAHVDLGVVLASQGQTNDALSHYRTALAIQPTNAVAHANLGGLLSDRGELADALRHLTEATRLQPGNAATRYNFALALARRGLHADAVVQLREVLRLQPAHANAINRLAWLLATSPTDTVRDGPEALRLATRLNLMTGEKEAMAWDTLAAAFAECGRFEEAVAAATQAVQRATAAGQTARAEAAAQRRDLYIRRSAFRERPAVP